MCVVADPRLEFWVVSRLNIQVFFRKKQSVKHEKNFSLFTEGFSSNNWWVILKEFVECYSGNLSRYVEQVLQQPLGRYKGPLQNIWRVLGKLSLVCFLNSEWSWDHLGLNVHPPLSAWTMYINLLLAKKLFIRLFDSINILSTVRNHSCTFKSGQNKTRSTCPNCQKEECEC